MPHPWENLPLPGTWTLFQAPLTRRPLTHKPRACSSTTQHLSISTCTPLRVCHHFSATIPTSEGVSPPLKGSGAEFR